MQGAGDTNIHMVRVISDAQRRGLRGTSVQGQPELALRRGESQPDQHTGERSGLVRVQSRLPQQVAQQQQKRYLVSPGCTR